jgi:pimeloyl-ACP methyl ester carboxylesterase
METQYFVNLRVWSDFVAMRDEPGFLAREFSSIESPVVVIHGEHDPHPLDGIRPFLEGCLKSVRFHVLGDCGHYPWIERRARESFFELVRAELR